METIELEYTLEEKNGILKLLTAMGYKDSQELMNYSISDYDVILYFPITKGSALCETYFVSNEFKMYCQFGDSK